jgi:hypothetical protein
VYLPGRRIQSGLPGRPGRCCGTFRRMAPGIPPSAGVRMMVRRVRPLGAALGAIAVGAMVTLAACGSQGAAGRSAAASGPGTASLAGGREPAGVALCRDIPQLTSVVVSRTAALHELEPGVVLPRGTTIREPRPVRALATALCALPKVPRGPVSCPAQFRGSLRFAFAARERAFPPVTVQVSGCRLVTGLGPARTARSAAFWRTLGKDLGPSSVQSTGQSGGIKP